MPIRFRCPGCDGLLSIATRKAGAEVACPKCREGLIVPTPVGPPAAGPFALFGPTPAGGTLVRPKARAAGRGFSFERSDFGEMLEPAVKLAAETAEIETTAPQEVPAPPPGYVYVAPMGLPVAESGVFLSRPAAVALGAGFAVMVGASFAAGFLVGR